MGIRFLDCSFPQLCVATVACGVGRGDVVWPALTHI